MSNKENSGDNKSAQEAMEEVFITKEDLTAERLTELFRHQRIHHVEEKDGKFQFIFRNGNTITVDPTTEEEIWGETYNKYNKDIKRAVDNTDGIHAENILEVGDLVRLKEPHSPSGKFGEYTHGIVVEVLNYFGDDLENTPRRVSLHLYNPETHEIFMDDGGFGSPTFFDQHIKQLILLQKASDSTYNPRNIDIAEY